MDHEPIILGIESSCDDTSAAVLVGHKLLSNVIASQAVHTAYGGVVPELASRAHEQNIVLSSAKPSAALASPHKTSMPSPSHEALGS